MPTQKQIVAMMEARLRQHMSESDQATLTPEAVAWLMENCGGNFYEATLASQIVLNEPPPAAPEPEPEPAP